MRFALVFIFFINHSFGQEVIQKPFINNYFVSINHSLYNISVPTYGFGLGVNKSFESQKRYEFSIGLEYNFSNQVQGYEFTGGHSNDNSDTLPFLTAVQCITIPFDARIKFLNENLFIECGVFFESLLSMKNRNSSIPEEEYFIFSNGVDQPMINFGANLGFGLVIPVSKVQFVIKPEARFGIFYSRYLRICLGIKIN